MRTRTIFEAYTKACIDTLNAKEWRQRDTFERELLRRMDERDALVAARNMNQTRTYTDGIGRFMTVYGKWGI